MLAAETVRNTTKLTRKIRNHHVFAGKRTFNKIFPTIGLGNFKIALNKVHIPWKKPCIDAGWLEKTRQLCGSLFEHLADRIELRQLGKQSNLTLVFSSDGFDGMWDIATMSMRAIKSCQSWSSDNQSHCLVGSIIDPHCGVVYLTNGRKGMYGTDMLFRCVVRHIMNDKTPALFLEKMYLGQPVDKNDRDIPIKTLMPTSEFVKNIFVSELHGRSGLPVIQSRDRTDAMFIPLTDIVDQNWGYRSYTDSHISYKKVA